MSKDLQIKNSYINKLKINIKNAIKIDLIEF